MANAPSEDTQPDDTRPTLGHKDRPIRILNFAGGGFDTIMQLGVTHALLVIQGRAPDAVVGVSAGAIQAAALAEILQAGETPVAAPVPAGNPKPSATQTVSTETVAQYTDRTAARVARLRDFVNACYRAPEQVLDAVLPDAYQIDSRDPLQPMRVPRLAKRERDARQQDLVARSGLVRLYNDLLGLHLPVGTITRMIRRILGYRAAVEIPSWGGRLLVRLMETFRLWLLVLTDLVRLVPLFPVLIRPVILAAARTHATTAGALIFRFRSWRLLTASLQNSLSFLILSTVAITFSAAFLPVPFIVGLARVASQHDRSTRLRAFWNAVKGLFQLLVSVVSWYLVLLPAIFAVGFMLWPEVYQSDFVRFLALSSAGVLGTGVVLVLAVVLWGGGAYAIHRLSTRHDTQCATRTFFSWYAKHFLKAYNLSQSLFHSHGLEFFLTELFDPDFYGRLDLDEAIENSLRDKLNASGRGSDDIVSGLRKRIAHYSAPQRRTPIKVGFAVADVSTGELGIVPEQEPVVSGLLSATAIVPFLPARHSRQRLYIDGSNVANVPTRALLSLLRRHNVNEHSSVIQVYSVAPLPFSHPKLGPALSSQRKAGEPYLNLIEIALRALKLRQFRDAGLERRLTNAYTEVLPVISPKTGAPSAKPTPPENRKTTREYYRIRVTPVELDAPVGLNSRILSATKSQRRSEIIKTIADGCRAAMQAMIAEAIQATCGEQKLPTCPCQDAVNTYFRGRPDDVQRFIEIPLPGRRSNSARSAGNDLDATADEATDGGPPGPGLWEVCQQCALREPVPGAPSGEVRRTLICPERDKHPKAADWPHAKQTSETPAEIRNETADAPKAPCPPLRGRWPGPAGDTPSGSAQTARPPDAPPVDRPMINLLFSGGVFRGVFQVGVLNALNELNIRPDVVAGASIGSITASMAARVLGVESQPQTRQLQLARLAATYLAVDQIILTDRFAGFIREFTIRGATTRFSLRQADQLFRKYDYPWPIHFGHGARKVIAGLERLCSVNPYQLNQLTRYLRNRHNRRAGRLGRQLIQQWLDRLDVGEEILGAEPLRLLIRHFALYDTLRDECATFDDFIAKGVVLLATCTDLTNGQLVTLGDPFLADGQRAKTDLINGLLASSAFPGVFRPRWSTEVFPESYANEQFIDGGVMDNLPIEPLLQFLLNASAPQNGQAVMVRRPSQGVPHLVFAASLEANIQTLDQAATVRELQQYWPALGARAKQLGYNTKLDIYTRAAQQIREIYDIYHEEPETTDQMDAPPLDLDVVAVKPNWLCGTFAFHPMLGYRRARQAESIAHGCASTLLRFRAIEERYLRGWNVNLDRLPQAQDFEEAARRWRRWRNYAAPGACWLDYGRPCPFSERALRTLNETIPGCSRRLRDKTIVELAKIHVACCRSATHRPM